MKISSALVCALFLPWAVSASVLLKNSLQPEVVARTLARVEDEWRSQAAAFAECEEKPGSSLAECTKSHAAFGKSCGTVVEAVVKGSSGDQNRARDYMKTVCGQKSLSAWHRDRCLDLKQAIDGALQFNEGGNRAHFNPTQLCTDFWSTFAQAEKVRAQKEAAAQKEALVKANEQAKLDQEKRQQEAARKQALEAHRVALEARERAAQAHKDAAERLAQKKAETEALAIAAQEKVKKASLEAAKAAEEHQRLLVEHQQAEEHLRKAKLEHEKAELEHKKAELAHQQARGNTTRADALPVHFAAQPLAKSSPPSNAIKPTLATNPNGIIVAGKPLIAVAKPIVVAVSDKQPIKHAAVEQLRKTTKPAVSAVPVSKKA